MSATFFNMRRRLAAAKKPEPVVEPVAEPVVEPEAESVAEDAVEEEKPKGRKKKE